MLNDRIMLGMNPELWMQLGGMDGAVERDKGKRGLTGTHTKTKFGILGKEYNGADSITNCGKEKIDNIFDGGGAVSAWIKPSSDGKADAGRICDKHDNSGWWLRTEGQSGNSVQIAFYQNFDGTNGYWDTGNIVTVGNRVNVAVSYDNGDTANNPTIYINGIVYTVGDGLTEQLTPVGTRLSDATKTLYVGSDKGVFSVFDGSIFDVMIRRGQMGMLEAEMIYERTGRKRR